MALVSPLETVNAQELLLQPFDSPLFIVEDLIPTGLHLFVGAPKVGKSWWVLDLGLHVSKGEPFWGYATVACDVLYLCLEDTLVRVQQRLFRLTDEANEHFHFATSANKLADGLVAQMEAFVERVPSTKLIILDTFQMIRKPTRDNPYAADYNDLSELKGFADRNRLALLVIHHTRKADDSDVFNTVSGTTGITGSADSTFVLTKPTRHNNAARLCVTGRDIEYQEFKLRFTDCRWRLEEKTSAEELEERDVPASVLAVLGHMTGTGEWRGTASELAAASGVDDVTPSVLSKYLNEHRHFLNSRGIDYSRVHTNERRLVVLKAIEPS